MSNRPASAPGAGRPSWPLRIAATLLVVGLLAAGAGYVALRLRLPRLDGTATVHGLSTPVAITRDALGIPTVRAETRADAARAVGYLHAQDRFFQMDLMRRRAAG